MQPGLQGTKEGHSPAEQSGHRCEAPRFLHGDAQADTNCSSSCQDPSPLGKGCVVKGGSCLPISIPKPWFPRVSGVGRVRWGRRLGLPGGVRKASSRTTPWREMDLFISTACLVPALFILDWVNPPDTNECALVNKHHGLFFFCCCCCCCWVFFFLFQLKLLCLQRSRQHNLCRLLSNF